MHDSIEQSFIMPSPTASVKSDLAQDSEAKVALDYNGEAAISE